MQISKTVFEIAKKNWKTTGSARKGPNPKSELDLDDPTASQPSD
jgi:hypothetical protein